MTVVVKDVNYTRFKKILGKVKKSHVKIGFPSEGGVKPPLSSDDGFESANTISEIASIAAWNEFGATRGIPERPFMRGSFQKNQAKYKKLGALLWLKVVRGNIGIVQALSILGLEGQGDIQQEIIDIRTPGNADSTIKQKRGSDNPLINYGQMLQSVQFITKVKGA